MESNQGNEGVTQLLHAKRQLFQRKALVPFALLVENHARERHLGTTINQETFHLHIVASTEFITNSRNDKFADHLQIRQAIDISWKK